MSASQSMCPAMPVPASAASPFSSLNSVLDGFPGQGLPIPCPHARKGWAPARLWGWRNGGGQAVGAQAVGAGAWMQPQACTGWWGGEGLGSWVSGWTWGSASWQLGASSFGGAVSVFPPVDPPLPYKMNHWCSSWTVGCLYRPIVKAIWYGGGLVSWASL